MEQEFRIVIGGEKEDLGSRLRNLSSIPKDTSRSSNSTETSSGDEQETVIVIGKSKKEGKKNKEKGKNKKKKKKGKGLGIELMVDGEYVGSDPDDDSHEDEERSEIREGFIDAEEMLYGDDEDDDISSGIIDEQRRGYKKLKKGDDDFKKEFADEIGLLYDLLDEMKRFVNDNEKKLKNMESSRARGISKYLIDMILAVQQGKVSKLNIIKEIIGLKKTIAELKIKSEAKNKDSGKNSAEHLSSLYFQKIIGGGRVNAVNSLLGMGGGDDDDMEFLPEGVADVLEDFEHSRSIANDGVHQKIEERLSRGNPYRSEEGNAYIEHEHDEVQVRIKRYVDTNDWEFIAIDKNNQVVYDYPVPDPSTVGKMKFSSDGTYATDGRGMSYKVIDVYA